MIQIEAAMRLASLVHRGQLDKTGHPYVYHLMRVVGYAPEEFRVAAMLHDVIEDTWESPESLRLEGVSQDDIDIIVLVSRLNTETYEEFITRIIDSENEGALRVKIADIKDHLNNPNPFPVTPKKYLVAYERLNDAGYRRWVS